MATKRDGSRTRMLIQNGTVLTDSTRRRMDIRITHGIISEMAPSLKAEEGDFVVDGTGLYVAPGFVDIHTHGGEFPCFSPRVELQAGNAPS